MFLILFIFLCIFTFCLRLLPVHTPFFHHESTLHSFFLYSFVFFDPSLISFYFFLSRLLFHILY